MKTDLYTKIVLTVIALCLVIIVLGRTNFISKVDASKGDPMPVVIQGIDKVGYLGWDAIKVEVQK